MRGAAPLCLSCGKCDCLWSTEDLAVHVCVHAHRYTNTCWHRCGHCCWCCRWKAGRSCRWRCSGWEKNSQVVRGCGRVETRCVRARVPFEVRIFLLIASLRRGLPTVPTSIQAPGHHLLQVERCCWACMPTCPPPFSLIDRTVWTTGRRACLYLMPLSRLSTTRSVCAVVQMSKGTGAAIVAVSLCASML